jgi:hypothetical protein
MSSVISYLLTFLVLGQLATASCTTVALSLDGVKDFGTPSFTAATFLSTIKSFRVKGFVKSI